MRSLPLFIAWRYLFARKRYNAINIVTHISVLAISVVSMALVCVLSIYNGYEQLILSKVEHLDPQLLITDRLGHHFSTSEVESLLSEEPGVVQWAPLVRGEGLLSGQGSGTFAATKFYGIDSLYLSVTGLAQYTFEGVLSLHPRQYSLGLALAMNLSMVAGETTPLILTVPKRTGYINPILPSSALLRHEGQIVATIYTDNIEYDNLLYLPIQEARELLLLPEDAVHGVALNLEKNVSESEVKHHLSSLLPDHLQIQDRPEQQPHLMRLVAIEKWVSFMILAFILFLAAYNVMAGLSMLIISKQEDITILHALGERQRGIQRIFLLEGLMITLVGALMGIVLGLLLCYLQTHFGWIRMNVSSQSIAYPVLVQIMDLIWVLVLVIIVGYVAAFYPVRQLLRHFSGK